MSSLHHPIRSASAFSLALALASLPARAAQQAMSHVWGGEGRHVYAWVDPMDSAHMRVWTCEDGARIRYLDTSSGGWSHVARPSSPTLPLQSLLGIYTPDGTNVFAVGQEGQFLSSTSPTGPWTVATTVVDSVHSEPARLWGIRYFSASGIGFLTGEHVLRSTQSGGVPATEPLFEAGYAIDDLEFYGVGIVGTSSDFQAVALAEGVVRYPNGDPLLVLVDEEYVEQGVGVFWTSSAHKDGNDQYTWFASDLTFLDGEPLHEEFEAWDVAFVPGATDPESAVGYMVGGLGNNDGRLFKTCDGGQSWVEEPTDDPILDEGMKSLYGVHAFADGSAIACGYGGQTYVRPPDDEDPCEILEWSKVQPEDYEDPCDVGNDFSGPLTGVSGGQQRR